ncbi:MAG: B12-binding domain-containing radical SAM protein [Desulfuromonas sp.]|nr:MAG: B12-binding domain-containing radical SAM protein [Desulfuromonas sp.]
MRTLLTTLHSKFIHNSLALPCIAAYCGDACGEILIREYTVHEPKENILSAMLAEKPDVIAFSTYIWNRRETLELVDLLSTVNPELKLVIGGPEVSFEDAGIFTRHPGLTALIRGEGEIPMRGLLSAWQYGKQPAAVPRLAWRDGDAIANGPDLPPLDNLDDIPSPFSGGLVDTARGFVYLETSRGCPYNCSFCMSALDDSVRSFSMERIKADLSWLLEQQVGKVKLVDRTFNYDAPRAYEIFKFILDNNRETHFHFEIGGHLLDEPTLELLEQVPKGMFHFEIGVQSTLPETLTAIDRKVSLDKLLNNIEQLSKRTRIELHLDLIAGLPGETAAQFLDSIDRLFALNPDHLQIEPVKLLPGAPLRDAAKTQNLRYDPNPPYTITSNNDLDFADLECLRAISRFIDLTWNSGRLRNFLRAASGLTGGMSKTLELLALHLQKKGLFRLPLSQNGIFEAVCAAVEELFAEPERLVLTEHLARDYALCERVIPARAPGFFDTGLRPDEQTIVRQSVQQRQLELRGQGTKLQYFAAVFRHLDDRRRHIRLFFYLTRCGTGRKIDEIIFPADRD